MKHLGLCALAIALVSIVATPVKTLVAANIADSIVIDSILLPNPVGAIGINDFNQDGLLDIIQRRVDSSIHLLLNNGDKTFTDLYVGVFNTTYTVGDPHFVDLGTGDFDGDSYPDVIMANDNDTLYFLHNKGDSTFTLSKTVAISAATRYWGLDCADVNGDGFIDFAVSRFDVEPFWIEVYINDGIGNFSLWATVKATSIAGAWQGETVTIADFTGDGQVDIVGGQDEDKDGGAAFLFAGDGLGVFTYVGECYDTNPLQECCAWDIRGAGLGDAYDYDNDGYPDVLSSVFAQVESSIIYFHGNDSGLSLSSDTLWTRPEIKKAGLTASPPLGFNGTEVFGVVGITANNWMYIIRFPGTQLLSDTLTVTTEETCLTCPAKINVIASLSQPIAGVNVPPSFDTSVLFIDSVSFVDTCVSGWNLNTISIFNDSGFLQVGLLNTTLDVIPPGVCTLFTVYATPKTDSWPSGDCVSAQLVFDVGPIDTTLSGDPARQLLLTDTNFADIVPVFIKTDSVLVHNFTPGDATANGTVNISDVTFLISRIFGGGSAPCPACAGDEDGSGTVNIADVTYLIARIFSGGPGPLCPTKCLNP